MREPTHMFSPDQKARGSVKPGTIYAISGEDGWIYYGQVTPDKAIGFFRRRDKEVCDMGEILSAPIMAIVDVFYSSVGRALRSGSWKKLGQSSVAEPLFLPRAVVQWPVGTLIVTVWEGGEPKRDLRVEDPSIQQLERMSVWDAEYHIPERLTADFGSELGAWHIGGPIWRERIVTEEMAQRFPDMPWHALPEDWVPFSLALEHPPTLP